MDTKQDYTVKIISSMDIPVFNGSGTTTRRQVTFMVGNRGPFTKQYEARDFGAALLQADIAKEVSELRKLDGYTY